MRLAAAAAAACLCAALAACASRNPDGARLYRTVAVPSEDSQALGRIYRLIQDGKYVIAEMRLRDLQDGVTAEVTRGLVDVAFAEILYRKGIFDRARAMASRNVMSPYDEVAADSYVVLGKVDVAEWNLAEARKNFDSARRISREAGLNLREAKAREHVQFAEALILFDSGAYREAREVLTSFNDPDIRAIVDSMFRGKEDD